MGDPPTTAPIRVALRIGRRAGSGLSDRRDRSRPPGSGRRGGAGPRRPAGPPEALSAPADPRLDRRRVRLAGAPGAAWRSSGPLSSPVAPPARGDPRRARRRSDGAGRRAAGGRGRGPHRPRPGGRPGAAAGPARGALAAELRRRRRRGPPRPTEPSARIAGPGRIAPRDRDGEQRRVRDRLRGQRPATSRFQPRPRRGPLAIVPPASPSAGASGRRGDCPVGRARRPEPRRPPGGRRPPERPGRRLRSSGWSPRCSRRSSNGRSSGRAGSSSFVDASRTRSRPATWLGSSRSSRRRAGSMPTRS